LSFRRCDGNKNGCKRELAAPTVNSERNYKCLRLIENTTASVYLVRNPSERMPKSFTLISVVDTVGNLPGGQAAYMEYLRVESFEI